ncbi:hypothetical protein K7X08_033022 [Anisodus acutangulus]|uniref:Uncharacterized protein n=1 Tax=Anisodus acutangulus TaxID=402998 RepID=A0A9Q1R9Q7_9SOLA|nr:hypothetical protein K7X08_033022 [Anisodus acutangulus]
MCHRFQIRHLEVFPFFLRYFVFLLVSTRPIFKIKITTIKVFDTQKSFQQYLTLSSRLYASTASVTGFVDERFHSLLAMKVFGTYSPYKVPCYKSPHMLSNDGGTKSVWVQV